MARSIAKNIKKYKSISGIKGDFIADPMDIKLIKFEKLIICIVYN